MTAPKSLPIRIFDEADDRLLSDTELCALLGGAKPIHPRTLRRMRQRGDAPPSVKIANKPLTRLKALREFLLARERVAA